MHNFFSANDFATKGFGVLIDLPDRDDAAGLGGEGQRAASGTA